MDEKRMPMIGMILMGIMLVVYFNFFAPSVDEQVVSGAVPDSTAAKQANEQPAEAILPTPSASHIDTTVMDSAARSELGIFAIGMKSGGSKPVSIENEDVIIKLDAAGGKITEVILKNYQGPNDQPVKLLQESTSKIVENVKLKSGQSIDLNALSYQVEKVSDNMVIFQISANGQTLKRTYQLDKTGFVLDYDLDMPDLAQLATPTVDMYWGFQMKLQEKDALQSFRNSTINYYEPEAGHNYLKWASESLEQIQIASAEWFSFKQKFFNAGIITDQAFTNLDLGIAPVVGDPTIIKVAQAKLTYPVDLSQNLRFYFGPNEYAICSQVAEGYEENVYLGWWIFAHLNRWVVAPLFHLLEGSIANYGIIILVLVLIIKSILFPLTYRSYKSMATMKALKPELDDLKEKYGDDAQKIQMKSMEVYRSFGVNPLAGCIPMVAQMPVFLALYNFFPNAIELRKEGFLWADDLSSYDAIVSWTTDIPLLSTYYGNHVSLFTILWCGSMILQASFNSQMQAQQQPGPMQYLPYIMPLMLLFVFNSFSSGLTFYYFVSNLITVGQQWGANKFLIDQEKIRRVLEERKAKRSPQAKTGNKIDLLKKARGKQK